MLVLRLSLSVRFPLSARSLSLEMFFQPVLNLPCASLLRFVRTVQGKAYNGAASDIWSCGVILFALISGRLPFDDENIRALLGKVRTGKYVMDRKIQGNARDLVSKMLEIDPKKRITVRPELLYSSSLSSHASCWLTFV